MQDVDRRSITHSKYPSKKSTYARSFKYSLHRENNHAQTRKEKTGARIDANDFYVRALKVESTTVRHDVSNPRYL